MVYWDEPNYVVTVALFGHVLFMLRTLCAFVTLHCTVSMLYSLEFWSIWYILPCGVKAYGGESFVVANFVVTTSVVLRAM